MAPKSVSGRVVNTGKSRSSSAQRKVTSAPSERPIQLRCIVTTWSGQRSRRSKSASRRSAYSVIRKNHCSRLRGDDLGAAALAAAVDHLLVGEDGLVGGAPLHGRLGAVGEAALEEAEEEPLGPPVVVRVAGCDLSGPVERDAPGAELAAELLDGLHRRGARVLARLDRVVLGGEAEGVVAHGWMTLIPVTPAEVGDGVADGVDLEVAYVRLAGGVGQHLEDVGLGAFVVEAVGAGIRHLPGVLVLPDRLPAALDRVWVVAVHAAVQCMKRSDRDRSHGGRGAPPLDLASELLGGC